MDVSARSHNGAPVYDVDFYNDDFIRDRQPHYAAMRALGAVVWLSRHGNYAVTRYNETREVLRNHRVFSSAHGVAADQFGCDFMKGNTIASDPPFHDLMRSTMQQPLLPRALAGVQLASKPKRIRWLTGCWRCRPSTACATWRATFPSPS
jgi:cytochrome P450